MKPDARITDIVQTLADAEEYVRGIVGSFVEHGFDKQRSVVRIGVSGRGIVPNYSIEEPGEFQPLLLNDKVVVGTNLRRRTAFSGQGHREILENSFIGESWIGGHEPCRGASVSRSYLSQLEKGVFYASLKIVDKLSRALQIESARNP